MNQDQEIKRLRAQLDSMVKAAKRVLLDVDDDGVAERGDIAVRALRDAVARCQTGDEFAVTSAELLRAMHEWGAAGFEVTDRSVGFLNYFLSQRQAAWHWRQAGLPESADVTETK